MKLENLQHSDQLRLVGVSDGKAVQQENGEKCVVSQPPFLLSTVFVYATFCSQVHQHFVAPMDTQKVEIFLKLEEKTCSTIKLYEQKDICVSCSSFTFFWKRQSKTKFSHT